MRIDGKGRMSIPAKFRRVFESADPDWQQPGDRPRLVIVYGRPDWQWIELFTIEAVDEIDAQIDLMPRGSIERRYLESVMHGAAEEADIDGEGRLILPQKLRDKIGLQDSAFFIAAGDYLKLWNPETYTAAAGAELDEFAATLPPGFDPRALLPPLPRGDGSGA